MKKISKNKLALRTESIRHLASQDLVAAQGGAKPNSQTGCASDCDTFKCASAGCVSTHHLLC